MLVYEDDVFVELLIFANRGDTTTCFNLFADFASREGWIGITLLVLNLLKD